jgi:hypothetical protein
MNRIIIHRKMESGEAQTDGAATCIYLAEVRDMMQAFARANTREGAERKLALKTLWRCSGRPGEPALISYEGLKWDTLHKCIFAESPQSKPSKVKLIPFVAGIDRQARRLVRRLRRPPRARPWQDDRRYGGQLAAVR